MSRKDHQTVLLRVLDQVAAEAHEEGRQEAFDEVRRSLGVGAQRKRKPAKRAASKPGPKPKPVASGRNISEAGRAKMKKSGTYVGLLAHLSVPQRKRVKRVREQQGLDAAIRVARSLRAA